MPFKNLLIKYEAQQKALVKALDALEKIKSISHLTSSCEHRDGKCPWRIADEAIASIRKIVG